MNPGISEEGCPKVEDKVDPSKLLPGLQEDTGECSEADTIIRGSEAVQVGLCTNFLLVLQIDTNFLKLEKDFRIINGEGREAGKCASGIGITMVLDQPTR